MKFLKAIYLAFLFTFRPFIKRFYQSIEKGSIRRLDPDVLASIKIDHDECYWFHGSSLGELEILIPVIECLLEKRKNAKLIVTTLSQSTVRKLGILRKMEGIVVAELCPIEGQWADCFRIHKPKTFVTAKYDLFPELVIALCDLKIQTVVVCARLRTSLKTVKWLAKLMNLDTGRFHLVAENEYERKKLSSYNVKSQIHCISNPRWDQIKNRLNHATSIDRFNTIKSRLPFLAHKNVGFIAQVYLNDSTFIESVLSRLTREDFIFIVPHELNQQSIDSLLGILEKSSMPYVKTSSLNVTDHSRETMLAFVDEIGVLTELYTLGQVTYVGGGFGPKGIHSVSEPACAGHKVFSGTMNANRFPEVEFLKQLGLLYVSNDQSDLANRFLSELHEHKRTKHEGIPFGGAEKTADFILNLR